MSTTTREPAAETYQPTVDSQPVSLGRAVAAEWVKLRTLRSSWLLLAIGGLGLIVLALVVAYNTRHIGSGMDPEDYAGTSTLQGFHLDELLLGALGVLTVSGEYATGTIRATLVAVPGRLQVLWAKLIVLTPLVFVVMLASAVVAFVSSQALLSHYRSSFSLSDPGVLRGVVGTAVYLGAITVIGGAIAWTVRNTAGALVTYLGLLLVLPVIAENLLGSWGQKVGKFLPSEAGMSLVTSVRLHQLLSPAASVLVLLGWIVLAVGAGAATLVRRDA